MSQAVSVAASALARNVLEHLFQSADRRPLSSARNACWNCIIRIRRSTLRAQLRARARECLTKRPIQIVNIKNKDVGDFAQSREFNVTRHTDVDIEGRPVASLC